MLALWRSSGVLRVCSNLEGTDTEQERHDAEMEHKILGRKSTCYSITIKLTLACTT
jgi:hypothetical protein